MELCYDGALVLPSSYAVMDEEEMTYLEGGSKKDILEAHNSRKFNIIGIVCQIIAVIFIMIILKMQG